MDAMSDAIEGADVMLYGVSVRYKESANVSLAAVCTPCAWLSTECQNVGVPSEWLTDCMCAAAVVVSNGAR
jgi:hypothetical protein